MGELLDSLVSGIWEHILNPLVSLLELMAIIALIPPARRSFEKYMMYLLEKKFRREMRDHERRAEEMYKELDRRFTERFGEDPKEIQRQFENIVAG